MNVTIPGHRWLSLNGSHQNPRAYQAGINDWKTRAIAAIRAAKPAPVQTPVEIIAYVCRTTNAASDAPNVMPSIKACIDAAVTCGVIPDDNDKLVWETRIRRGPNAATPTIELVIRTARPEKESA